MSFGVTTAYRLVIEGLGIEAVTDPAMERSSPDLSRVRVVGLLREGLRLSEQCDVARGEIEASGMTVSIVDRQHDQIWCSWLAQQPERRAWLTTDLPVSDTTVDMTSTEGIAVNDVIHIGTEAMLVFGVNSATQLEVTRAWWQTIEQAHYTSDGEELVTPIITLTRPITLEGRRVYLYRYADGDSLQGDGTLVWRGVCSTDARLEDDGGTWTITVDSIASLIKQPLASDLDEPTTIRGIYYPEAQFFRFRFGETSSADIGSFTASKAASIRMHGFWETQADWCADIQLAIDQASSTAGAGTTGVVAGTTGVVEVETAFSVARDTTTIVVETQDSGHWGIRWIPDSANPRHIYLTAFGVAGGGASFEIEGPVFEVSGDATADVTAAHPWVLVAGNGGVTGQGLVPRAVAGGSGLGRGGAPFSSLRLYPAIDLTSVALAVAASEDVAAQIEWTDGSTPSSGGFPLRNADADEGWVEIQSLADARFMYPGRLPRISLRRYLATGDISDLRDGLTTLAPQLANAGGSPFITTEDLASWTAVAERAAGGRTHLTSRLYVVGGEVDLDELIAHECRLYGVFPRLDADGKIGLAYLELPTSTAILAGTIDDGDVLVSDQPPTWERNATDGSINVVELKSGYSLVTEDHEGVTFIVRDVTALSTRKATRKLEVAPLSLDPADFAWGVTSATDVARRVLAIFGRPYSIVKVAVSVESSGQDWLTSALCGSVLGIRSPRIPNALTGTRGIGQGSEQPAVGLVIGREWDLSTETGVLTLMVSEAQTAGYAPSVFVSSSTVVSGNQYDLVVSFNDPSGASMAPAGASLSDFYTVGDVLLLLVWDSTTQSPQSCAVDAIDDGASEMRVTFGSAPTLTGTRYLTFSTYDDPSITTSQRRFAFFADASALLDDGAGGFESAREYSA
jgi:hypothetical protein